MQCTFDSCRLPGCPVLPLQGVHLVNHPDNKVLRFRCSGFLARKIEALLIRIGFWGPLY